MNIIGNENILITFDQIPAASGPTFSLTVNNQNTDPVAQSNAVKVGKILLLISDKRNMEVIDKNVGELF